MTTINQVAEIKLTVDAFAQYLEDTGILYVAPRPHNVVPIYLTREDLEQIKENFMSLVTSRVIAGHDPLATKT
jgi:hypothetical protein